MSGGVDSSVAAALLVDAGHEVVGATLRTFCYSDDWSHPRSCCGLDGVADAREVARRLGVPHSVVDVEDEFTRDVIDDFVQEYASGRTPNPCVRCNSFTKFRDLLQQAREMGADGIATGHYVRARQDAEGRIGLFRGRDRTKDQTYFLWGLSREILPFLHFPLGERTKEEVRGLARDYDLGTADKPESQEICFVPSGDYRDLLKKRLHTSHPALEPGLFVTTGGEVVGEHQGYAGFTVGQRRGLPGGSPEALFVVEIRARNREVVVGTKEELFAEGVELDELNWLATPPGPGEVLKVQLRHRAPATPATIVHVGGGLTLRLHEPQPSVTPGQSGVLFREDHLVGGGRIQRSLKAEAMD
jgi:tRNA-specific 2-thiouridylase